MTHGRGASARRVRRLAVAIALLVVRQTSAQITLDGTLGPKSALKGPDYVISADVGKQVGNNLFHSFGDFNVHTHESATFTGPNSVDNVIGRVTGGNMSTIDGRLSCDIPNANLYLVNPAGVMFGPNATLDVHGSFAVSTADYVKLADGGRFDAQTPSNSVLTSAVPAAFGFLSQQPAPIAIDHSNLAVSEGRTVSLIGGDLTMTGGSVSAPSGRINVASVVASGEVIPEAPGEPPTLDVGSVAKLGNITLSGGAQVSTSGEGGGAIIIRGGRFEMQDASQMAAVTNGAVDGGGIDVAVGTLKLTGGSRIDSSSSGTGKIGGLRVTATEDVTIDGGDGHGTDSGLLSQARAAGDAGTLSVTADTISLLSGSTIDGSTFGPGRGSDVTVKAADSLTIAGEDTQGNGSILFANTQGSGDAGTVDVEAGTISLAAGGTISSATYGVGRGGSVAVKARDSLTITGADTRGRVSGITADARGFVAAAGDAGTVDVEAGTISLAAGGRISSATVGVGRSGSVVVKAADSLTIAGEDTQGLESGIFADALGFGGGDAGTIDVEAGTITLAAGSTISSATLGVGRGGSVAVKARDSLTIAGETTYGTDSGIFAYTQGSGDAGTVDVEAGTISLAAGGTISSATTGVGRGGSVAVKARDSLTIAGSDTRGSDSGIFASAQGTGAAAGDAGSVKVEAGTISLAAGGRITSSTSGPGRGGMVQIGADTVLISGRDQAGFVSQVSAASSDIGSGGDVQIGARRVELSDGGTITAANSSTGAAGIVDLSVGQQLNVLGGQITDEAPRSEGGTTTIDARDILLENGHIRANAKIGANLNIKTSTLVLLNGSEITTNAEIGQGGDVRIDAQGAFLSGDSRLSASGQLTINSPDTNIAGVLTTLPQTFLRADALLNQRCAAHGGGRASSFIVAGREAMPIEPDGFRSGISRSSIACP